ncbi:uncharacterized protein BT62DRAFT_647433 [Guyanagaster necrorhizus]|uniref:Zn(2)-C6 fungal-type domain-containing protein n=1 Tax=Guyanagaster necrorhizus TaxID=856835 RepID=A0A9P7VH95_9AGAR|nr:uncharacterized protein BT62DRAFT_647433 [Guyanagaster necrorhizus MCA 3950]KAG7440036.1 hypothetical protein BT62DRAFT_647433 [Guyanagaster necrorhizus MCA 3950]
MPIETQPRKKRAVSDCKPDSDVDHRKRRRNRTTQSCLNCHTSKRMCDRKRPACARCTQLGLTGLCVYEVDDPNQRSDTQDESLRLLKRVAELEGVIRELKNKPHPRWLQPGCQQMAPEAKSSSQNPVIHVSAAPDSTRPSSSAPVKHPNPQTLPSPTSPTYPPNSLRIDSSPSSQSSSCFSASPVSTPSPTATPVDEFSCSPVAVGSTSDGLDLVSMFMSYPDMIPSDHSMARRNLCDLPKTNNGHCGCLHEAANYRALLELSLRLRKAADVLARSPRHHSGSSCSLQRRVSELDTHASTSLGDVNCPPDDTETVLNDCDQLRHPFGTHTNIYDPIAVQTAIPPDAITPLALHGIRPWDSFVSDMHMAADDPMMNWEPRR